MSATMTGEQLPESIPEWSAAFDHDRLYEIEDCCQEHAMGVHRRGLLAMLTMDSEKVFDACEKEPEAFFGLFEKSAVSVRQYRQLSDLLEAAHNRLMTGLCVVDFKAPGAPFSEKEFLEAIHEAKGEDE